MRTVETVLFLVIVATVVATFARRLRIPAPSLLVVAGVVVGLVPGVPAVEVTPEIVSLVVLPPLLFAAGEELAWRDLRAVWRPVTVLAVGLVLVSAVPRWGGRGRADAVAGRDGVRAGCGAGEHGSGRGDRAGAAAVAAVAGAGAGAGGEPVQRRDEPAVVPGGAVPGGGRGRGVLAAHADRVRGARRRRPAGRRARRGWRVPHPAADRGSRAGDGGLAGHAVRRLRAGGVGGRVRASPRWWWPASSWAPRRRG